MFRFILVAFLFLFPVKQNFVCFAAVEACPTVDIISGAGFDTDLAMLAAPSGQERHPTKTQQEKGEVSPKTLALLIVIMILMVLIGVLRLRFMAMEKDIL